MTDLSIPVEIQPNKVFIFKGKKYPVDFSIIMHYSNYFYQNSDQYQILKDIEISDENLQVSDTDFQNFISCCQNQNFQISDSNVFSLYQLSQKFDVPSLQKVTNEYIEKNHLNVIFDFIHYKSQNHVNFQEEENIVSSNFNEFMNDEKIFSLPIPILFRILNNENFRIEQNDLIEFLFKCLDKYGKEASVLFSNFNFENSRIDFYSRLINNYSNVFNFNMINREFLMSTTNELLSELNQMKIEFTSLISEMKTIIEDQKSQFEAQKEIFRKTDKETKDRMNEQIDEIQQMNNSLKEQIRVEIDRIKEVNNSQTAQIQEEIQNFHKSRNDIHNELNSKLQSRDIKLSQCETKINNFTLQHDAQLKSYITKNQLRSVLEAGKSQYTRGSLVSNKNEYPDSRKYGLYEGSGHFYVRSDNNYSTSSSWNSAINVLSTI